MKSRIRKQNRSEPGPKFSPPKPPGPRQAIPRASVRGLSIPDRTSNQSTVVDPHQKRLDQLALVAAILALIAADHWTIHCLADTYFTERYCRNYCIVPAIRLYLTPMRWRSFFVQAEKTVPRKRRQPPASLWKGHFSLDGARGLKHPSWNGLKLQYESAGDDNEQDKQYQDCAC